jgi:peptidoglycan/xylan/chitin deacetylase (PgdA/CDA1 family)
VLKRATAIFREVLGFTPKSFRAPNFSANYETIRSLEQLGYNIDSSVLPGRIMKQHQLFTLYDFRSAPRHPYHPSYDNIAKVGNSKLLEFPLTENPFLKGAPLGIGFLNMSGPEATLNAIEHIQEGDYLTFLIHPYELVELEKYYPCFKRHFQYCYDNFESLEYLIRKLKNKEYTFCDSRKIITISKIERA